MVVDLEVEVVGVFIDIFVGDGGRGIGGMVVAVFRDLVTVDFVV